MFPRPPHPVPKRTAARLLAAFLHPSAACRAAACAPGLTEAGGEQEETPADKKARRQLNRKLLSKETDTAPITPPPPAAPPPGPASVPDSQPACLGIRLLCCLPPLPPLRELAVGTLGWGGKTLKNVRRLFAPNR